MDRKLIVVAVCASAALSAAASAAFGQEQKKAVPKLHIMHATKAVKAETGEAVKNEVAAMGASKKSGLPLFTYTIQSDRDGQQYTGVIVGADPTSKGGNKSTSVKYIHRSGNRCHPDCRHGPRRKQYDCHSPWS